MQEIEIGIVKFFGKSKDRRAIDYGEIQRADQSKIRFWNQDIQCELNDLISGVFVIFEIQEGQGVNINILRDIGIIVKTRKVAEKQYYGFIKPAKNSLFPLSQTIQNFNNGKIDLYFKNTEYFKNGIAVSFGLKRTYKKTASNYQYEAITIELLQNEEDKKIINHCFMNCDEIEYWLPVLSNYKSKNWNRARQTFPTEPVLEKIPLINLANLKEQKKFWDLVSEDIFLRKIEFIEQKLNHLKLTEKELIEKLCIWIKYQSYNLEVYNFLIEKLELIVKEICNLETSRAGLDSYSIWRLIPDCVCERETLWDLVPNERKISVINNLVNNQKNWSRNNEIPDKLINLLNSCSETDKNGYLNQVPDDLKYHPKVFKICSPLEQIRLLGKIAEQHPQRNQGIIADIAELIQNHKISIGKIPKSILVHPSIRDIYFHYPNVETQLNHPEAEKIRAFANERGIQKLVHLTTLENFWKICESTAILSQQKIQERGIELTPFDTHRLDKKLNHICCSITYYNFQMFYHLVHKSGRLCVLMYIKPDYLWKERTLFSPINAASGFGIYIKTGLAGLQSMFADEVRDNNGLQTRLGKTDNLPTCIQAEVLVHESISLEDVVTIIVPNYWGIQKLLDLGYEKEKIQVIHPFIRNPFNYCSNWIVKEQP